MSLQSPKSATPNAYELLGIAPSLREQTNDYQYYFRVTNAYRHFMLARTTSTFLSNISQLELDTARDSLLEGNPYFQKDSLNVAQELNSIPPLSLQGIETLIEASQKDNASSSLQKLAFALNTQHASVLKQALNDRHHRYDDYFAGVIYQWRVCLLELFGEELLDDNDMREMLAFGLRWSHCATRKLINPIRWLAAIVILTADLYISLIKFLKFHATQLFIAHHNVFYLNKKETEEEYSDRLLQTAGAIIAALILVILFPSLITDALFLWYGAAVFFKSAAQIIAMPINKLIRPVINFIDEHPYLTLSFLSYKLTSLLLTLIACYFFPAIFEFFVENELSMFGLSLLFGLPSTYLSHSLNKQVDGMGYVISGMFSCSLFLYFSNKLLQTGALIANPIAALAFICNLFGVAETVIDFVNLERRYASDILEFPLPNQLASDEQKETLKAAEISLTNCSHRLFSTPKQSQPLTDEDRDWTFQLRSCFGLPLTTSQ